jgi:hypothetical protein
MNTLIEFLKAAGELPPHVTEMLTHTVPWVAVTIMVAAVLYFTNRERGSENKTERNAP